MQSLATFIDFQEILECAFAPFLASLHPTRIVTLKTLIENPYVKLRLRASWLDHALLTRRLAAAWSFLEHLPQSTQFRNVLPLVIIQATDEAEDIAAHKHLCRGYSGDFYAQRYGHLPPQFGYLHIDTNFLSYLREEDTALGISCKLLRTLKPYANADGREVAPHARWETPPASVLGYHIPDYPRILGVSSATATDYFARILIHDIGHGIMPHVPSERESIHNATMLYAMDVARFATSNPWEELIHHECTDPLFFLDAAPYLDAIAHQDALSPLQKTILKKFRSWYVSAAHTKNLESQWGITPGSSRIEAERTFYRVLRKTREAGFACYSA